MSSTQKTALVIGATGLVGSHILQLLLQDTRYSKVKVFGRRSTQVSHEKLEEYVVKFDEMRIWKHLVQGDELYSALGTTIKLAGTREAQYRVDFEYQLDMAELAFENGVGAYGLISSLGASAKSKVWYTNMKGKLDKKVRKIGFEKTVILRPSILKGKRESARNMEMLGSRAADTFSYLPVFKKYKPIHGKEVAQALINAINSPSNKMIYEGAEVFELLSRN